MLLKRGDAGPGVDLLQERLRQLGCLTQDETGFGEATWRAVRRFQTQQGLAVDGLAGRRTLGKLFPLLRPNKEYLNGVLFPGEEAFDDLDRLVEAVAAGEGGAFDAMQLNGDGAGLSFGILQWAQAPGSLHPLLPAFKEAAPDKFVAIFGAGDAGQAEELLAKTRGAGKRLALWQGVWPLRFWLAGREPVWQRVQRRLARRQVLDNLEDGVRLYPERFKPEGEIARRALVMLADVANQAGPGGMRRALKFAAANYASDEADFIRGLGRYVEQIIARKYGSPDYGNTRGRHETICRQYSLDRVAWAGLKEELAAGETRKS